MESITLKKNYLVLAMASIVSIVLGTICFLNYKTLLADKKDIADLLLVFGCILFFFSVYFPYRIIKIPDITIVKGSLQVGTSSYDITSIKELLLTAKLDSYSRNNAVDGIKITFYNDQVLTISSWKYTNINKFKVILKSLHINKTDDIFIEKEAKVANHFSVRPTQTYKGSFLWSFQGIFFICTQTTFLTIWLNHTHHFVLAAIVTALSIYIFTTLQVNYIILNGKEIVIKNYLFPWMNKVHLLSEIIELHFESNVRVPFSITIIYINYNRKKYLAGTIRDSEWRKLKTVLKQSEIPIMDNQNI